MRLKDSKKRILFFSLKLDLSHRPIQYSATMMKISSIAILAALSIPLAHVYAETAPLADVVNVGARPYFLLDKMKPSSVKDKLGMILQS